MSAPSVPLIQIRPRCAAGQIRFYWAPPASDGGSAITKYTLECAAAAYSQDLSANVANYIVTGLTNGTDYTFTLTASNIVGTSPAATFRTVQPGVIPYGPTTVTATRLTNSTATINWNLSTIPDEGATKWFVLTARASTVAGSTFQKSAQSFERARTLDKIIPGDYYDFLVQAVNDTGYCRPFAYSSKLLFTAFPFTLGAAPDILYYARALRDQYSTISPTGLGPLTINGNSVGDHEVTVVGDTVVSSFTSSDWFTSTEDTTSSWIIVKGGLEITTSRNFTPATRKLFTVVYVTGNLIVDGALTMTARGANHSGTGNSGGYTAPTDIRLATGTFSAVVNPQIPSGGGTAGSGRSGNDGVAGGNGSSGGSGGGGSGAADSAAGGNGAAGTCFSGGAAGGGAVQNTAGGAAVGNGGAGGAAAQPGGAQNVDTGGGAGNPGGVNAAHTDRNGAAGTGGTLIIICEGAVSGSGTISANGVTNISATTPNIPGGSSGGGSVTVFYRGSTAITPSATGGSGYVGGYGRAGGAGGSGTARSLVLP